MKHPATYAERLASGVSPEAEREVLNAEQQNAERILLGIRLAGGMSRADLAADTAVTELLADGLIEPAAGDARRVVLTLRGRLLADAVTRALIP